MLLIGEDRLKLWREGNGVWINGIVVNAALQLLVLHRSAVASGTGRSAYSQRVLAVRQPDAPFHQTFKIVTIKVIKRFGSMWHVFKL